MTLQINDIAPDFEALTTEGKIKFHDFIGSSWLILFFHPVDFTPIWITELGVVARMQPEFAAHNLKIIGLRRWPRVPP